MRVFVGVPALGVLFVLAATAVMWAFVAVVIFHALFR